MLDMGWTEILVIGVVALIVVGPKDLPRMLRTLGQYTGKMRGMAREFQRSMDDAAREADLAEFKDIKESINDVRKVQQSAKQSISKTLLDTDRDIEKAMDPKPEEPSAPTVTETSKSPPLDTSKPTPIDAPASVDVPNTSNTPSRTGTDGA